MDNSERVEELRRANKNLEEGIASNNQEIQEWAQKIIELKAKQEEERKKREENRKQGSGN